VRGLLHRLGQRTHPRGSDPSADVASHLHALLNTRAGSAPGCAAFGMVDFSDLIHSFPKGVPTLGASIRTTILAYEPRLKNVSVRHVPDEDVQRLKFEITAQLADGPKTTVRFRTEVSPSGQVTVA
jgi:type VI secretion system protein